MSMAAAFTFAGGIGLFLLGMRLMTDGLKVAAGDTLRQILAAATRSRIRGLATGILITTLVQSSSAVIFATIGFVNAGLLTLAQAVGVIYGSNLGTTLTSWIVALVGFNLDLRAMAMPCIGIGMGLWVAFRQRPVGALGQAIAGLGLFFLGIDVLRDTFADAGSVDLLEAWADRGTLGLLLFLVGGIMLTVLMQSSSAALAVTLTAAAGGLVPLQAAAAMVIGANVGTTSTAAFAVIGATASAKRAATAHVLFNVLTAVIAFAGLPLLLWLVAQISSGLGLAGYIATSLAIFHTLTKLLGLTLMWPLTSRMVKWLEGLYRQHEDDDLKPRHLDRNIRSTPSLAMDALALELHRVNGIARDQATAAINAESVDGEALVHGLETLEALQLAIGDFVGGISGDEKESSIGDALAHALRVSQYATDVAERSAELVRLQARSRVDDEAIATAYDHLRAAAVELLGQTQVDSGHWDVAALKATREAFEDRYQTLKGQILRAGTVGTLPARRMATALEVMSALHRIVDQATKAALYLDRFLRYRSQTESSEDASAAAARTEAADAEGKESAEGKKEDRA
ncbi:MAG: Na/Pi cotransporter family protein [Gammaproteobacteria bacterium]|nr:MAG: Na/Pi cotransporter family protein [Gammaproteobacteria bacterium]